MTAKKLMVLVLSFVLVFTIFGGCGTAGEEKDQNTLTLLWSRNVSDKFIEGLKAEFPDINFELEYYQGANYTEYAHNALTHGEGADIFMYTLGLSKEDSQKYLVDLSGNNFLGNFDMAMLDSLAHDGCVYQLPGPVTARAIIYNKTLFEMNDWKVPTTFNELIEVIKQIRQDEPEITPIMIPLPAAGYPFTLVTSLAQCGFLSTPEGAAWEESYLKGEASVAEGFAEGFTMVEQLIDANAFDGEKGVGLWNTIGGDFCERRAAMAISFSGTSVLLPLLDNTADLELYGSYAQEDEFALLPFFGIEDGQEGISVAISTTWGLNKELEDKGNEKKLENGLRVMEWLSTQEAQLLLQTDSAQIPTIKNLENTNVHPDVERLWDLNENGKKSIYLYSGYEDIMNTTGDIVKEAILADSSVGMRDKFIAEADKIHKQTIEGQSASHVYGVVEEHLTHEETATLSMASVMEKNPADFMLATYRGTKKGLINNKGLGGRLFAGKIVEMDITTIIQTCGDTIHYMELTGAEVKELLVKGKTISSTDGTISAVFEYFTYGLDVKIEDDEIVSVKFRGEELDDNKTYKVNFFMGDYETAFGEAHNVVNTEIPIFDAYAEYITKYSPLNGDKIK